MGSISLESVRKVFGDGTVAVKDVSLHIDGGEFVVFVGPSGCGKSTLLRMIAGLERISSGQVKIDNKVINDMPPRERDVAMVFQNYALYPHMSVRENIGFALEQRRLSRAEIERRVAEAARILDLSLLLDRKPKQLSGGQRQRVAMGRAMVRDPQAFLLDEPLSNLDAKLRVQMRAELGRLHSRLGVTTIHVTHDQIEAMTLGNRVAVFSQGMLQQYASPHAIYHDPVNTFVAGFVGSPAMNFMEGVLEGEGGMSVAIASSRITVPPGAELAKLRSGGKVLVGFRPEHLRWLPAGAPEASGIRGRVELVEQLEPESFVVVSPADPGVVIRSADDYVRKGRADEPDLAQADARVLTLRVSAGSVPHRGDLVDIIPDPERIYLFDAENGASLGRRAPHAP
jgi:multiple sugar transport system ATP-binding protein